MFIPSVDMELFHSVMETFVHRALLPMGWLTWVIVIGLYFFWSTAYVLMIVDGKKAKSMNAPLFAVAVMLAFEVCFCLIWPLSRVSMAWGIAEWVWFIADIALLVQAWRYISEQLKTLSARLEQIALIVLVLGLMYMLVLTQNLQNGLTASIIAITLVAWSYPPFLLFHSDARVVSLRGQVARALGDLCVCLAVVLVFPAFTPGSLFNCFTSTLMLSMLLCDAYTVLLLRLTHRRTATV